MSSFGVVRFISLMLALGVFVTVGGRVIGSPRALQVYPSQLALSGYGAQHGILVTLVQTNGARKDVTDLVTIQSSAPEVMLPLANAQIRAVSDGRGEVIITYEELTTRLPVVATATAQRQVPSFRQDVLPLLTKAGCNSGGCHGKLAGQNGFRLSLRGYAPEWDHDWLTTEVFSRRINYAVPDESLLVLKALGKVPHEGGQRFSEYSPAHQLLRGWIAARTPGPLAGESDAARLEILPGPSEMTVGAEQQLLVRAYYPDGRVRDVTWLCQFYSNDETVVTVTPEGRVHTVGPGETAVRVHFQSQVEVVLVTVPFARTVDPALFAQHQNVIDEHIFPKLQALRIPPAGPCDDATFLRRVSLDLTGTLPSSETVRKFLRDTTADKRGRLVEQLLQSSEFVDYWTLQWSDLFQNRKERDHDVRGTKGVRSFHAWLRSQVAANRPWDQLARALLTASGDSSAHPEIGYYITTVGEKSKAEESEVADAVAQAFLGTRIGCARCHNHPLERYTQDDYYHFAAFFSKVSLKRESPDKGLTVLQLGTRDEEQKRKELLEATKKLELAEAEAAEKAGATNTDREQAEKKLAEARKRMEDLQRQLTDLQKKSPGAFQPRTKQFLPPQPLDRQAVEFSSGEDLRTALADWVTTNANFSGAMVNRLWKQFFNVGLVEQVDDLRASNPPSNPGLWEALQREFGAHNFDVKHVMRLIVHSRAYQLSAETQPENEQDRRFYSHYYARRLPAEVMLDAIGTATGVPDSFPGYPAGTRAIQLPEPGVSSYFLGLFGRSERVTACACERSGEVTLPQLLHLQNGDELMKKISADTGRLRQLLKRSELAREEILTELYYTTLSRPPSAAEMERVLPLVAEGEESQQAWNDLFWALLNTKEFAFNH